MQPRPYQFEANRKINESFDRVDRTLMCLPTGTGKTAVFVWLINQWREERRVTSERPVIIMAHREELLQQAINSLIRVDQFLPVGLERAGSRATKGSEVIVASVQTVGGAKTTRLRDLNPSLVIIDEAHHAAAKSYWNPLYPWGCFDGRAKLLGCTATPKRLDRKALIGEKGAMFQEVAYTYSLRDAVRDKWLCDLRGFRVETETDLDSVGTVGGDFAQDALAKKVDNEARTLAAYTRWAEVAAERKTVVFCASVAHAQHAQEVWASKGIVAECVHGEMTYDARAAMIGRFRSNETQALMNCAIVTEGADFPDVSCIVMLKPTKSWSLYVQMAGRGTRICEGKTDCIILDVVDNTRKHELATVPSILDLPAKLDLQGKSLEEAAVKLEKIGAARGAQLFDVERPPRTFDEIDSRMETVDLLGGAQIPSEVSAVSRLAWMRSLNGGYVLPLSGVEARLEADALGGWTLYVRDAQGQRVYPARTDNLERVLRQADKFMTDKWADKLGKVVANARWRERPASSKQIQMLRRLGFQVDGLRGLKMGTASALIDKLMGDRESERVV